jgi:NAD(P)H-dependent FMN reductase
MKKLLAFGASNSKNSINKTFAAFAANQIEHADITIADLNDFPAPLYSVDLEYEQGIDQHVIQFDQLIQENEAFVISLAEYNGLHTAAFKNLWDWLSRIPREQPMNIWGNKPMFLLSTSPSKRLGSNVFQVSKELFPHFGANIVADFHLPSFNHFFKDNAIVQEPYAHSFQEQLTQFKSHL